MPDFLVFAAAVPKLLGSRVVAYMHEPSPELATRSSAGRVEPRARERVEQGSSASPTTRSPSPTS